MLMQTQLQRISMKTRTHLKTQENCWTRQFHLRSHRHLQLHHHWMSPWHGSKEPTPLAFECSKLNGVPPLPPLERNNWGHWLVTRNSTFLNWHLKTTRRSRSATSSRGHFKGNWKGCLTGCLRVGAWGGFRGGLRGGFKGLSFVVKFYFYLLFHLHFNCSFAWSSGLCGITILRNRAQSGCSHGFCIRLKWLAGYI